MRVLNLPYQNLFAWLKNSVFVKNILIVMTGSALAQIIGFALTPVISRLFAPSDFGVFGSFSAVVGIVAAGITLDYSQAIMLPKEKNAARDLFFVACLATIVITLVCAIACYLAPDYLMGLMRAPNGWALVLFILALLIRGANITLQAWCVRIKAFKHTSGSQVLRSVSSSGLQIGSGLMQAGPFGLIVSSIMADFIASINLLRGFLTDFKNANYRISRPNLKKMASVYRDFPFYSASGNIINALSMGLPVLLLSHYFGIAAAGAYAFADKILSAPMGLILQALRQVLFQKAAETEHQGGSLLTLYIKSTLGLFALAVGPALVLLIWAPPIFTFIFGEKWTMAGQFAGSLVIWLAFMFCNLPSVLFARILRLQRQLFIYGIIMLIARALALILGGIYLTGAQTVFWFSVVGAIMNINYIVMVGRVLMKKEGTPDLKNMTKFMKGS